MIFFTILFIWALTEFIFFIILLRILSHRKNRRVITGLNIFFILLPFVLMMLFRFFSVNESLVLRCVASLSFMILISKLITVVFYLILFPFDFAIKKFFARFRASSSGQAGSVYPVLSRKKFIETMALAGGGLMFSGMTYGILRGAYQYSLHRVRLHFPNLPKAFQGLRIVQISDLHIGSFFSTKPVEHAFSIVMEQKPDIIFFTGDLVNNRSKEVRGFESILSSLRAPMGIYSILGNHDYGDYVQWESEEEKKRNRLMLEEVQKNFGWTLLKNQGIWLEKNGEKIGLAGVENWSVRMHFPRYGDLKKALSDIEDAPFVILLSHDPSHWEGEVIGNSNIGLTLSGHTHGMQFGVEIPGFKWSPVKYIYRQWAGLYQRDSQFLYVNRGLGFIGYSGRLGIWPEITLIELT